MDKMRFPLLERGVETLGDWNPQLMREIQGRCRLRSVLLTGLCSIIGQALFLFWRYRTLTSRSGRCDQVEFQKTGKACVQVGTHYLLVNWQHWWLEVFTWGCILLMFGLVVGGSFLLISDLSREERRGTLTFISLSPQTARTILMGKLLGVPILIFVAALLAVPLHYVAGVSAQIAVVKIVNFDVLLLASCLFFYSLALLLGIVCHWLHGFQSWLGSMGIFMLLLLLKNNSVSHGAADWLSAFTPTILLPYVTSIFDQNRYVDIPFKHHDILGWQWFHLPFGRSGLLMLLFALVNYGFWTGWLWQPLQRRFRNPHRSLLSKKQSYLATICVITCYLGFSVLTSESRFDTNLVMVLMAHLLWFLLLIVFLLPQHQALEDWARFRNNNRSPRGQRQRTKDLLWADNSPTAVAIVINLGIAGILIMAWMVTSGHQNLREGFVGLLFNSILILILTLLNQVVLLQPLSNRNLWTTGTLLVPLILPTFLLVLFGLDTPQTGNPFVLLTPFSLAVAEKISLSSALPIVLLELGIIVGLSWQLKRQLNQAGESTSQRLFRGDQPVEPG